MDVYSEKVLFALLLLVVSQHTTALVRGDWSAWGSCTSDCNGKQERTRKCVAAAGETCKGLTSDTRTCNAGLCLTTSMILCIVFGLLVLLAFVVIILLAIRRRKDTKRYKNRNIQSPFSFNTPEELYDRSIRKSSSQHGTTFSSIASSRATIPTIAPYLPDLDEEGQASQLELDNFYTKNDDLERISLPESIHEASFDFDVDQDVLPQPESSPRPARVVMLTFAETQTDKTDDDYGGTDDVTDDELKVHNV